MTYGTNVCVCLYICTYIRLTTRKGRKRRRMRRKYKVHISPNGDGHVLKQSSADAKLKEFKKIPESSPHQTVLYFHFLFLCGTSMTFFVVVLVFL